MRTPAQIEASRANGAKSHGPVTAEGKARSAANSDFSTGPRTPDGKARSARNGRYRQMLANSVSLEDESRDKFVEILEYFRDALRPVGFMEEQVVEVIAVNDWRRRRLWFIGKATIDHAIRHQRAARDPFVDAHQHEVPMVYCGKAMDDLANSGSGRRELRAEEALYNREYRNACKELKELQAERRRRDGYTFQGNLPIDDYIDPRQVWPPQKEPEPAPTDALPFDSDDEDCSDSLSDLWPTFLPSRTEPNEPQNAESTDGDAAADDKKNTQTEPEMDEFLAADGKVQLIWVSPKKRDSKSGSSGSVEAVP